MLYYTISRVCRPYDWYSNLYYVIGLGIPVVIVSTTLIISEYYDLRVYIRTTVDEEADTCRTVCWIQYQYLWMILLIPIAVVTGSNFCVALRTVIAAYTSASFR